ncbi:MAG: hypothetical protein ABIP51_00540, partial [Bacteroidia bacterium]
MANKYISKDPLGQDSEKGGVFFGSNLTPNGTFSNVPNYYTYTKPSISTDGNLVLTLQKIKDSLKDQIKSDSGAEVDDAYVEKYLYEFVNLLVDYRDMRNYVFYGSANTELAFNIKTLIENYPYKFWVATLTTSLNTPDSLVEIINNVEGSESNLIFSEAAIKDGIEQFNFFDNSATFNWSNYEVVDKNGNRYKIKNVTSPYFSNSSTIHSVLSVGIGTQFATVDTVFNPPVSVPSFPTMQISTPENNNYVVGEVISLLNVSITDGTSTIDLAGEYVISELLSSTTFLVVNKFKANEISAGAKPRPQDAITLPTGYTLVSNPDAMVRRYPSNFNERPYKVKMTIEGNFFENYLQSYTVNLEEISGFIISPTKTILSEFEFNLTQIQKILLAPSPINPTPWPRRSITNNLQNLIENSIYNPSENDFINWLQNPEVLFLKDYTDSDDDVSFSDVYAEYRLVRALSLDETTTNQLVRRCIPADLLSELNDTPEADFQRFILIAGWFFD